MADSNRHQSDSAVVSQQPMGGNNNYLHDVHRLWKSQQRQVVHGPATAEASAPMIAARESKFMDSLSQFFTTLLHVAAASGGDTSSIPLSQFLQKTPAQSCLATYARLSLVTTTTTSEARHGTGGNPTKSRKVVRLLQGRRAISLPYTEFMSELDHFMLRGNTLERSDEWVYRHSYGSYLHHCPKLALACIGTAMSLAIASLWQQQERQRVVGGDNNSNNHHQLHHDNNNQSSAAAAAALDQMLDESQIIVRFVQVEPRLNMMDIKTGSVGKFITVKGSVVKCRPKRLRVATADFACPKCGACITHEFQNGRYSMPAKCITGSCKARAFRMKRETARYINVQELRLQEAQEESTAHSGRTPRQMEVEVTHDLVDCCRPGDIVMVAAIVDTINSATAAGHYGKRAKETSTYKLFLQGHSITTMSESSSNQRRPQQGGKSQTHSSSQAFTQRQLQAITQLCHADHRFFSLTERRAFPFDLLVRSICPAIVGHHEVKAGILLCLLGGTPPISYGGASSSSQGVAIRSNSHMLVVGDPGMGKSMMLLAASQLAARSVYVGGNTASTTGLTVTLTKEERGESGIEAGALVLADQGVCCIDEFDKMAKSHQDGLLEAMEQQQVSIAKAGVVASLPARTSVLAAANPKNGSYNCDKTVAENLNMSKPILSRFDLVFILRDKADKDLDHLVSSNIMNLHRDGGSRSNFQAAAEQSMTPPPVPRSYTEQGQEPTHPTQGGGNRIPIYQRLAWVADFQKQPLPADLVRDYIAYARQYCMPKLTGEAAEVLQEYYMKLRYPEEGSRKNETVPITTRQLEALIRLSQARAKACLRDFVIKDDALDVVELMRKSVDQVHTDEAGSLDRCRGGAGGRSKRKLRVEFINELHQVVGIGASCSMDDLRCIADRTKFPLSEFQQMIDDLREGNVLLKQSDGRYVVLN